MKKLFLLFAFAILVISCSQKVEIKGKISNANPLDRIEIIETSGIATLPIVSIPVQANGEFSTSFDAPKNGTYLISYAGKTNMIFLKKGDKINITGEALVFPKEMEITGDGKANNEFLKNSQKEFENYALTLNTDEILRKDEKTFLKEFDNIYNKVNEIITSNGKKHKANGAAIDYKKNETKIRLYGLLDAYQEIHGTITNNKAFKVSENFKKQKEKYLGNEDNLIKEFPMYRDYAINKLYPEFEEYTQTLPKKTKQPLFSELFADFLKKKKNNLSSTTKDYFLAFILSQADMNYTNADKYEQIANIIKNNISNNKIKKDLEILQKVMMGEKKGTSPKLKLEDKDGKTVELSAQNGKPTLVMFYASWNPNISLTSVPVMKEVTQFYKDKVNYLYVNVDDTKEQFVKTSTAMLKDFEGKNAWINGGINSSEAKNFGLYSFKLPQYILLDKDGKNYGQLFFDLGDPSFIKAMAQLTGMKAPEVTAEIQPMLGQPSEQEHNHEHTNK